MSFCISRHRDNRTTGQHTGVGSWLDCNLPYQTTESSLHHIFDTGGQAVDIQCTESVGRTGRQYSVSLGKDSSL